MTNLRRVATFLYKTGDGHRLIQALDLLLEVKDNQGEDVFKEISLSAGEVSVLKHAVLEKDAS